MWETMTLEERIELAMKIAEGFFSDVKQIQQTQIEMQKQIDGLLKEWADRETGVAKDEQ